MGIVFRMPGLALGPSFLTMGVMTFRPWTASKVGEIDDTICHKSQSFI